MNKKLLIILPLIISLTLLSGCLEIFEDENHLIGEWSRDGNPDYKIVINADGSGVALNRNANDYIFTWRLDSDSSSIMYWEIEGESTRVVYYYLLKSNNILVLEWDGTPSVYERG